MNAFGDIFGFIVQIFSFLLLIRLLLQLVQADFYNPISQTIFKICAPVVEPLSKLFPTIGTLNTAALIAAIAVQWSFFLIVGLIQELGETRGVQILLFQLKSKKPTNSCQ